MPVAKAQLLLFNNVETTDVLMAGVAQLPYFKQTPFIPNVSYVNGFQEWIPGNGGRGSQILIRKLGKGSATAVKATAANAFTYTHAETADDIDTVLLDDVIKQSEQIFLGVDVARTTGTGAEKANIVLNNIIEKSQDLATGYLLAKANTATATTAIATPAALKTEIIEIMTKQLNRVPDVLMVNRATLSLLYQLTTADGFLANPNEDVIRTGVLGTILGMKVILNDFLPEKTEFVMYDHNYFSLFLVLQQLTIVPAIDFDGSYARGLALQGGHAPVLAMGAGAWGVKRTTV